MTSSNLTSSSRANPVDLVAVRDLVVVKRALISVSDKSGVVELAATLVKIGAEIISTGSTAALLREHGFRVTDVATVTGMPEMLDGRVKTLHPNIHAGILADLRLSAHKSEIERRGIIPVELVVVNLYPFAKTVAAGASFAESVEQIDVGGPAVVRAAAKNHANVAVVVDPERYPELVQMLVAGGTTLAQRTVFARDAFIHSAEYDRAVATWLAAEVATQSVTEAVGGSATQSVTQSVGGSVATESSGHDLRNFPELLSFNWRRMQSLRYGENAHQQAVLYANTDGKVGVASGVAWAEQLGGKEMSYNNYVDADWALRAVYDFVEPAVVIVKHANPCGIASANLDRKSVV